MDLGKFKEIIAIFAELGWTGKWLVLNLVDYKCVHIIHEVQNSDLGTLE